LVYAFWWSETVEARLSLVVEGLDAFLEVVGLPKAAVAVAFELDGERLVIVLEDFSRYAGRSARR
jgi:hypothetical protein